MNRRETIKMLMAASGSLVALPAWANGWNAGDVIASGTALGLEADEMLTAVADTIIPAGNSIGALSVGVDKFLQKLFADCYENDVQDNVRTQLEGLQQSAQSLYGKTFKECTQAEREEMLLKLSASGDKLQEEFFKLIKSETIRGFNTSREVMVNYLHFRQVPGHYYGCVDVNA
jgi:hypothetical protein